jgi:hypothetical protein
MERLSALTNLVIESEFHPAYENDFPFSIPFTYHEAIVFFPDPSSGCPVLVNHLGGRTFGGGKGWRIFIKSGETSRKRELQWDSITKTSRKRIFIKGRALDNRDIEVNSNLTVSKRIGIQLACFWPGDSDF